MVTNSEKRELLRAFIAKQLRELRAYRKEIGLCIECKEDAKEGAIRCEEHLEKANYWWMVNNPRKKQRISDGH